MKYTWYSWSILYKKINILLKLQYSWIYAHGLHHPPTHWFSQLVISLPLDQSFLLELVHQDCLQYLALGSHLFSLLFPKTLPNKNNDFYLKREKKKTRNQKIAKTCNCAKMKTVHSFRMLGHAFWLLMVIFKVATSLAFLSQSSSMKKKITSWLLKKILKSLCRLWFKHQGMYYFQMCFHKFWGFKKSFNL